MTYTSTISLLKPGALYKFTEDIQFRVDQDNILRHHNRNYHTRKMETRLVKLTTKSLLLAVENTELAEPNDGQWLSNILPGCWVLLGEQKVFFPERMFVFIEEVK